MGRLNENDLNLIERDLCGGDRLPLVFEEARRARAEESELRGCLEYQTEFHAGQTNALRAEIATLRAAVGDLRKERDDSDSALHALVQIHHDAMKHKGIWSQCRDAACVEAQYGLLEKSEARTALAAQEGAPRAE